MPSIRLNNVWIKCPEGRCNGGHRISISVTAILGSVYSVSSIYSQGEIKSWRLQSSL
jgi:hypothetical protein